MSEVTQLLSLSKEDWEERIQGWSIAGCSLRAGPVLSLVMRRDIPDEELNRMWDAQVPTRVFYFNLRTGVSGYDQFDTGMPFPRIGASDIPESLTLCAARDPVGSVWAASRDYAAIEEIEPQARSTPSKSLSINRIARVGGMAYAVGRYRSAFRREGPSLWKLCTSQLTSLTDDQLKSASKYGFNDLHGLTESDMYAVGGHGDVWHFNGSRWRQCDFPSNKQLGTVTVAPDGQVYISGEGGHLWVGREDSWKLLHRGSSSVLFNDSRWFDGKLWLCSSLQLRVWDGEQLRRPTHKGGDIVYTGHMDAHEGLLVIAGQRSVNAFDGSEWHTLIRPFA